MSRSIRDEGKGCIHPTIPLLQEMVPRKVSYSRRSKSYWELPFCYTWRHNERHYNDSYLEKFTDMVHSVYYLDRHGETFSYYLFTFVFVCNSALRVVGTYWWTTIKFVTNRSKTLQVHKPLSVDFRWSEILEKVEKEIPFDCCHYTSAPKSFGLVKRRLDIHTSLKCPIYLQGS